MKTLLKLIDIAEQDELYSHLARPAREELAALREAVELSRSALQMVVNLQAADGGRSFPSRGLLDHARAALAKLNEAKP